MSKPIENSQLVTSVVHKTITLTTASGGISASAFESGSEFESSASAGAYYNHLNYTYYKPHNYPGSSGNGVYYIYTSDDQKPVSQSKNKWND